MKYNFIPYLGLTGGTNHYSDGQEVVGSYVVFPHETRVDGFLFEANVPWRVVDAENGNTCLLDELFEFFIPCVQIQQKSGSRIFRVRADVLERYHSYDLKIGSAVMITKSASHSLRTMQGEQILCSGRNKAPRRVMLHHDDGEHFQDYGFIVKRGTKFGGADNDGFAPNHCCLVQLYNAERRTPIYCHVRNSEMALDPKWNDRTFLVPKEPEMPLRPAFMEGDNVRLITDWAGCPHNSNMKQFESSKWHLWPTDKLVVHKLERNWLKPGNVAVSACRSSWAYTRYFDVPVKYLKNLSNPATTMENDLNNNNGCAMAVVTRPVADGNYDPGAFLVIAIAKNGERVVKTDVAEGPIQYGTQREAEMDAAAAARDNPGKHVAVVQVVGIASTANVSWRR